MEVAWELRLEDRQRKEHLARLPTRSKAWQWGGPSLQEHLRGRGVARSRVAGMGWAWARTQDGEEVEVAARSHDSLTGGKMASGTE